MYRIPIYYLVFSLISSSSYAQNPVGKIRKEFLNSASDRVLVASHRAVHDIHPENSLPAIGEAIAQQIDIVEIDVQVTRDGIPMLMHDGKIDRTTNGKGNLETMTFAELRKLRLKSNGQLTDEPIPTLEEALKVANGKIMVDLDLKTDNIGPVIEIVKKTRSMDNVFFFDSNYAMLSKVDSASKGFMLMPRAYSQTMADSAQKLFRPEVIHIDGKFYTKELTAMIRKNKARVWINALGKHDEQIRAGNESQAVTELLRNGANIIQTDEPAKLLKYLRSINRHD